jgi:drug/metabolite transporter (DMT)-like permease
MAHGVFSFNMGIMWILVAAFLLSLYNSAIAYISWEKTISTSPKTSSVSNYMFLTPFLTSGFGFFIINKISDMQTIIGGILILIGMFVYNFRIKR